jgi:hypothetical protein
VGACEEYLLRLGGGIPLARARSTAHDASMQRLVGDDVRAPATTLGAGVSGGFIAGVLIGGVGGRLAMLLLRVTSDPALRGVSTDDGFTIGRISTESLFLLGVTAGLGIAGGLFYLVVRRWIPQTWRIPIMCVFFALVGGAGIVGTPSEVDFTRLSPLPLAVGLFIAIPAVYGATMPWLTERLLRDDSILRRTRWGWVAGMVPLVFANIVGLLVVLGALGVRALGGANPALVAAWRSRTATWLGRIGLAAMAFSSAGALLRDALDILN